MDDIELMGVLDDVAEALANYALLQGRTHDRAGKALTMQTRKQFAQARASIAAKLPIPYEIVFDGKAALGVRE